MKDQLREGSWFIRPLSLLMNPMYLPVKVYLMCDANMQCNDDLAEEVCSLKEIKYNSHYRYHVILILVKQGLSELIYNG